MQQIETRSSDDAVFAITTPDSVPLCVDLDGTLIRTDLLYECLIVLLKKNPLLLLMVPLWLLRGRAVLKEQLCSRADINPASLPYNHSFLEYLRQMHARGRNLVLATAAHVTVAERIAAWLGIFSTVVATSGKENLSGAAKRRILEQRFGTFDYAGNSRADIAVWNAARRAIIVNAGRVQARAMKIAVVERVFDDHVSWFTAAARALRVHQWVKNLLVFVPLITSHQVVDMFRAAHGALAFLAMSLCASAIYILNDIVDVESDRAHPEKKFRPFAAGDLSIPAGLILFIVLITTTGALSSMLPSAFRLLLVIYFVSASAYSLVIKQKLLLDVFFLGALYTIRILAGGAATGITCSPWLLAFSMFLFLGLALLKRFSDLQKLAQSAGGLHGRCYRAVDLQAIGCLGTSSAFMCVLVLALYINSPQVTELYRTPAALWLLCPLLLYWLSRAWMIAFRGKMNTDPVLFALRDRVSYLIGLGAAAVMIAGAYGVKV